MNYLFILQHNSMDITLYKDILEQPNVRSFYVSKPMSNQLLYKIRRIHTSTIATKYFEPPMKSIWYKEELFDCIKDGDCVVFQIAPMLHIGKNVIKKIKNEKKNVKIALLLVDSIHAHSYTMRYAKKYINDLDWDIILSFDKNDCDEFGFQYIGYSYYSKLEVQKKEHISDLYYIGALKAENTRTKVLSDICYEAGKNNVKVDAKLLIGPNNNPNNLSVSQNIKILKSSINYRDVVNEIQSTNCILEIVQPGQNTQTARYMEAVCYNKKLLTNNKNISLLPYYTPKYMQVFENVKDIDFDWVKSKEKIDFNYMGDFSPVRILKIIEDYFN